MNKQSVIHSENRHQPGGFVRAAWFSFLAGVGLYFLWNKILAGLIGYQKLGLWEALLIAAFFSAFYFLLTRKGRHKWHEGC